MASSAPEESYSWLNRWDSTALPPSKYREGINGFLIALEGLTREDRSTIEQLYTAWWNRIASTKLSGKRLSAGSLMNLHSDLTKAIAIHFDGRLTADNSFHEPTGNHQPSHIALAYCKPPQATVDEHNKRNQLRLIERVSNRGWINKPFEIVARAERLLLSGMESNIYSDIAAALVVLTGRRVTEVLVTAEFSACTAYTVLFTGQLKTRGVDAPPAEIPTLIEAHHILHGVSRLRELFLVDETNRDLLDFYKDNVRRKVIDTFCDLVPTIQMLEGEMRPTTHRMRAVYNCLATFFYAPPGLKDDLYTKAIMAHEDRNSTLNYMVYQIADEVIAAHGGKRQGILLNRPGVEVLQVFQTAPKPAIASDNVHSAAAFPAVQDAIASGSSLGAIACSAGNAIAFSKSNGAMTKKTKNRAATLNNNADNHPSIDDESLADSERAIAPSALPEAIAASPGKSDELLNGESHSNSNSAIDFHRFQAVCKRLVSSPHFGLLVTGLVAATGRSIACLIKSGVFKRTDDPHQLLFSHQLSSVETITTLLDAALILRVIERLRYHRWTTDKRLRYEAPNQIEYLCRPLIQRSIKKFFAGIIPDVSYSGLIAAYELMAQQMTAAKTDDGAAVVVAVNDAADAGVDGYSDTATATGDSTFHAQSLEDNTLSSTDVPFLGVSEPLELIVTGEVLERFHAIARQLHVVDVADALPTILELAQQALSRTQPESSVEGAVREAALQKQVALTVPLVPAPSSSSPSPSLSVVEVESDVQAPTTVQLASRIHQLELQLQQLMQLFDDGAANQMTQAHASSGARQRSPSRSHFQGKSSKQKQSLSTTHSDASTTRSVKAVHKIDRAVRALMQLNNNAVDAEHKWFISESLIFRLTGCNRPAVRRYFHDHHSLIARHHTDHHLEKHHNLAKGRAGDEEQLKTLIAQYQPDN